MQTHALALALLLAVSAAGIHVVADQTVMGVPDTTCQTPAEWYLHDYVPPSSGYLTARPYDGNLSECNLPYSTWLEPYGDECTMLASEPNAAGIHQILCVQDRPADFDGDMEFAIGGATLAADTGDGVSYGSLACWDLVGHHAQGSTLRAEDMVATGVGAKVYFSVAADYTDPASPVPPDEVDCGDGIVQPCDPTPPAPFGLPPPLDPFNPVVGPVVDAVNALLYSLQNSPGATCTPGDVNMYCVAACTLSFPPGIDGSYAVFVLLVLLGDEDVPVRGGGGHIYTGGW